MADPQHPDWNYRCNLWRAGLGPDPGPPPDPQTPAVPFEQAVDLLTGEPRQLRPQHPDIAALVSCGVHALCTLGAICDYPRCQCKEAPTAARKVVEAALRTLARPVEDEEVRRDIEQLNRARTAALEYGWPENTSAGFYAVVASHLAGLARERDAARQNAVTAAEALRTLGLAHVEQGREVARLRKALLDATAHLAGATSAYEKFVGNSERRGVRDALYKTRLADFQKATGRAQATCRALAAAAGAEEPR